MPTFLNRLLAHPKLRGLCVDDPKSTALRKQVIQENRFLLQIYREWYGLISRSLPAGDDPVLELGSGGGFLSEHVPGLISSEVFFLPGVSVVCDGQRLPFADGSLRAIAMTNVLHHLPRVSRFFSEAERCVRPGGVVTMIEPWVSAWSRRIYRTFHEEPFDIGVRDWDFPPSGPLSGANDALPWILFSRDATVFGDRHPAWRVKTITPLTPFAYLVSGGVSLRQLMPGWSYPAWRLLERGFDTARWAMFAHIVLQRSALPAGRDS